MLFFRSPTCLGVFVPLHWLLYPRSRSAASLERTTSGGQTANVHFMAISHSNMSYCWQSDTIIYTCKQEEKDRETSNYVWPCGFKCVCVCVCVCMLLKPLHAHVHMELDDGIFSKPFRAPSQAYHLKGDIAILGVSLF
jgi:hypothetical protein